jgi:hypothetical protein
MASGGPRLRLFFQSVDSIEGVYNLVNKQRGMYLTVLPKLTATLNGYMQRAAPPGATNIVNEFLKSLFLMIKIFLYINY